MVLFPPEPSVEEALKDPLADGEWILSEIESVLARDDDSNPYLTLVCRVAERMGVVVPPGGPTRWSWTLDRRPITPPTANFQPLVFRYVARRKLIKLFGYSIPTDDALDEISKRSPLIEIGAGAGYWASCLQKRGVDIVAYDNAVGHDPSLTFGSWDKMWFQVQEGSVEKIAEHPRRTLILAWPPPFDSIDSMAADCLKAYQGDTLIHVGMRGELEPLLDSWSLEMEIGIPQWEGVPDSVQIWRR